MIRNVALGAALFLAGCAENPLGVTKVTEGKAETVVRTAGHRVAFEASRHDLRRIGYRNCNGYEIHLFAPRQVSSIDEGPSLFMTARAYRGGAVTLNLPVDAQRLQRRVSGRWQDVPLPTRTGDQITGQDVVMLSLSRILGGGSGALSAGQYRLWFSQLSAEQAAGGYCAISPVWLFQIT